MHSPISDNLDLGNAGGSKVQLDVHNVFVSTTPLLQIQCLTAPYTLTVGASEQRDTVQYRVLALPEPLELSQEAQ